MPGDYGSTAYWDERYAAEENTSFDWYLDYELLKPVLEPYLRADADFEVYIPGCGNSGLSAGLYEDGYLNISNTDISSIVISQMTERYEEFSDMDFSVLDATQKDSELPPECFDLILDKALLDSVLCGEDSAKKATNMVEEMYRVLKPGGVYMVVSFAPPESRLGLFTSLEWTVKHNAIEKPRLEGFKETGASASYHIYVCTKAGDDAAAGAGGGGGASASAAGEGST